MRIETIRKLAESFVYESDTPLLDKAVFDEQFRRSAAQSKRERSPCAKITRSSPNRCDERNYMGIAWIRSIASSFISLVVSFIEA